MTDNKEQAQREQPRTHAFNPNEKVIQLKSRDGSKDYLPVAWRIYWFREQCPHGTIETEMLHLDLDRVTEEETFVWNSEKRRSEKVIKQANGIVIFKATIKDGKGGIATGTKSEKAASFPDYIEKAETGSIGRALAALGYGTQFAPELSEEHRIVDSPVDRQPNGNAGQSTDVPAIITEQQVSSIQKLCKHLGKDEPKGLTEMAYLDARLLMSQLNNEYRAKSSSNKAS